MDNELKQFLKDHIDLVESENTNELLLSCPCYMLHRLGRFLVTCGADPEDLKPYYTYTPLPDSFEKYLSYVLNKLKEYLSCNFDIALIIGKKGVKKLVGNTIVQYFSFDDIKSKFLEYYENNELPTDDSSTEYFSDILDHVPYIEYEYGIDPRQKRSQFIQYISEMDDKYGII